eukprot:TRINITY_DN60033_c0_g1_i1.p1 TRINITY_DN60033_c0_g1~~TRINITY_DN60033_c0_g1_i1.p1  ORF type:complete len:153 (+),score=22.91 TRINITY_DN60033_c0_g1_i1:41-499(+)
MEHLLLVLGVLQVLTGCILGLIPENQWTLYRYAVTAHLEFTANGVLLIALGYVSTKISLPSVLGPVFWLTSVVGTWINGLAFVYGAIYGELTELAPKANSEIGAAARAKLTGQSGQVVTGMLTICGVCIITSLFLALLGLLLGKQNKKTKVP